MHKPRLLEEPIYSLDPVREKRFRHAVVGLNIFFLLTLILFWLPLRDPGFTYPLVSFTLSHPALQLFFRLGSTLGSEGFFLILFSVTYWSFDKALGFRGLVLMPLAIFLTSEMPKDMIRLPRPDVRGVAMPTYTFPSGHASGAVSVWGYLGIKKREGRFWAIALGIIFLAALSRVMLGYHYPGDVVGGIFAGSLFLFIFVLLGSFNRGYELLLKLPIRPVLYTCLPLFAILAHLPSLYAPNMMGYLAGAISGHLLEKESINFSTGGSAGEHLIRAIAGLFVVALLILGLGSLVSAQLKLVTFLMHAAATFWITCLAPMLFIKTGLCARE